MNWYLMRLGWAPELRKKNRATGDLFRAAGGGRTKSGHCTECVQHSAGSCTPMQDLACLLAGSGCVDCCQRELADHRLSVMPALARDRPQPAVRHGQPTPRLRFEVIDPGTGDRLVMLELAGVVLQRRQPRRPPHPEVQAHRFGVQRGPHRRLRQRRQHFRRRPRLRRCPGRDPIQDFSAVRPEQQLVFHPLMCGLQQ